MQRKTCIAVTLGVLALAAAAGCEDKNKPADPSTVAPPAQPAGGRTAPGLPPPTDPSPAPGHGHDHDHGDGHDHGDAAALGTLTLGGWTVKVEQGGKVEPGEEGHFDIDLSGSTDKPAAVRVWIGDKDGKGAMKTKAEGDGPSYHTHVEAPKPIPANAQFWVEIETAKGEKFAGAVDLKK